MRGLTYCDGHFPFCITEKDPEGNPFVEWDGATVCTFSDGSYQFDLPSRYSDRHIMVTKSEFYPVGFTLEEFATLFWRVNRLEFTYNIPRVTVPAVSTGPIRYGDTGPWFPALSLPENSSSTQTGSFGLSVNFGRTGADATAGEVQNAQSSLVCNNLGVARRRHQTISPFAIFDDFSADVEANLGIIVSDSEFNSESLGLIQQSAYTTLNSKVESNSLFNGHRNSVWDLTSYYSVSPTEAVVKPVVLGPDGLIYPAFYLQVYITTGMRNYAFWFNGEPVSETTGTSVTLEEQIADFMSPGHLGPGLVPGLSYPLSSQTMTINILNLNGQTKTFTIPLLQTNDGTSVDDAPVHGMPSIDINLKYRTYGGIYDEATGERI